MTQIQSESFISVLQKSVFEGIAQEALSECVKSLQSASDSIEHKKVQNMHTLLQYNVYALSTIICSGL